MRLKRVISAALAVSMAVSMMPATAVSAFAEGTTGNNDAIVSQNEVKAEIVLDGTKTLQAAVQENYPSNWKDIAELKVVTTGDAVLTKTDFKFMSCVDVTSTTVSNYNPSDDNCLANLKVLDLSGANVENNTIPARAFCRNAVLEKIYLPDTLVSMERAAFAFMSKLTYIGTKDGENSNKIVFPKTLTTIGESAFYQDAALTLEVDLPETIVNLGTNAFEFSAVKGAVTIHNNVNFSNPEATGTHHSSTFGTTKITSVKFEAETVPDNFAVDCNDLDTVTISDDVKTIGPKAFKNTALKLYPAMQEVTSVGNYAFQNIKTFTNDIVLKNGVTYGQGAFEGIKTTGNVIVNTDNVGESILKNASIGGNLVFNCSAIPADVLAVNDQDYDGSKRVGGNIVLNSGVTTIGDRAFNSAGLTGTLVIPDGVQSIGNSAFRHNQFSGTIVIPESVQHIGKAAFSHAGGGASNNTKTDAQNTEPKIDNIIVENPNVVLDQWAFYNQKSGVKIYFASQKRNDKDCWDNSAIILNTDGGKVNTEKSEYGIFIPEMEGYTFKGWTYTDGDDVKTVTSDADVVAGKTYTAKWEKNKYTVTLNNNGHGEKPAAMPPVEYGDSVTDLPKLSDSANEWVFDGWYMDENFATKYNNQAITGNTTLYAKWHEYQNTALTAKVSKSDYLVNTPADVNVTVTPGDDFSKLMQDKDNIKISLTYDDDVTSVMLNGNVLERKEYTIPELMQLMGQNRELKLNVTYGKAGTHTFGIALKNGNNIVSECGTDIVVAEEAAELTPATKLYTLTVKNADVTIKNGDEEIKAEKNDKGELIAKVPEKADVTVTYTSQSDAVAFDQWTITTDETLDVDVKNNPLKFQMPAGGMTIEAMTKDASIEEDEPNILGTAAVVGTAAAGTAILAWQGYQLGTELYLKTALPAGTAIPANRAELALLVWNHAGKPAPAAVLPADATDTQKAIAWAVENDLLKAAKDNGETYVDTDSVSRVEVIRVWNKAQEK